MKKIILSIVIIAVIILGVFWYHHSHKPVPLTTITLGKGNITEQAEAVGSIVPEHSVAVKSQLPGIVKTIFHQEGDYVKKGEKLLEISPIPTPQDVARAIEAVKEDEAAIESATKKLANYKEMLKEKYIKPTYFDYIQAKQELDIAKSKLKLDQQNLALIKSGNAVIDGKKMQGIIYSPIDGYILQRNVDVGAPVIAMGQMQEATSLFSIANMKDLIFKGSVDETDAGKLKVSMKAIISIGALPNAIIPGVLSKLALQSSTQNAVDNANKGIAQTDNTPTPFNNGFPVEINQLKIPANLQLRSGYSATAAIKIKSVDNVLVIPERALIFKDNKTYANIPNTDGLTSKPIEIKIGLSDGMQAEVISGLKTGDKVVDPNPPVKK